MHRKLVTLGASYGLTWAHLHRKPYCDSPVLIGRSARAKRDDLPHGMMVSMWGPCRKCKRCLQFRQMRWRQRIFNELSLTDDANRRSWFVTLTYDEVAYSAALARAAWKAGDGDPAKYLDWSLYADVQRFLKRLRKRAGKLRFAAFFELGEETGRGHWHLVIHECGPRPITSRQIERSWHYIVHERLVDMTRAQGAASYLSKYLTKGLGHKPKASVGYGRIAATAAKQRIAPIPPPPRKFIFL